MTLPRWFTGILAAAIAGAAAFDISKMKGLGGDLTKPHNLPVTMGSGQGGSA